MRNKRRRITAVLLASAVGGAAFIAPAAAAPVGTLDTSYGALFTAKQFSGGKVTISGTKQVGHTLSAKVSGLSPSSSDGAKYKYQWLRNGNEIGGAHSKTYKLTSSDAGKKISVKVTATKSGYGTKAIKSDPATIKSTPHTASGTFSDPYSYGKKLSVDDSGSWLIVSKPYKATSSLAGGDRYVAPLPGNDYWIVEGTYYNGHVSGEWGYKPAFEDKLIFKRKTGPVFQGECPKPYYDLYYPSDIVDWWGDFYVRFIGTGPRTQRTIYWCVEAPSNALTTGLFSIADDGAPIHFYK